MTKYRLATGLLVLSCATAWGQGPPPPSSMLQSALAELRQAIGTVQPGRWKASNTARDEVDNNLASMRHDLDATLPGLLTAADAAPASVAATLPVTRNVGALYDVLLRVVERGRGAAPAEQEAALERARMALDDARRTLEDRLQTEIAALEGRVASLQQELDAKPAAAPVTPAAVKTPKPKAKSAAKH